VLQQNVQGVVIMRKLCCVLLGVAAMSSAFAVNFSQGTGAANVRAQVADAVSKKEPVSSIVSSALSARVSVDALTAALVAAGVSPKVIVAALTSNGVTQEQAAKAALAAGADPSEVLAPAAAGPVGVAAGPARSPSLNFSAPSTLGGGGGKSVSRN
jgi:hypothetical protein